MNQFVLAFPVPVAVDEPFAVTEIVKVAADAKTVMIPGCSVLFNVVRQPASPDVLDIFKEHCELSAEEEQALSSHKSLLFLLGNVKSMEDVRMVNVAILKMLDAGALGVYMQQAGTTWTADEFRDTIGSGEYPMDAWINIIEGEDEKSLYTLGLATFSLPDLCTSTSILDPEELLLMVAHTLFGDGIPAKSGSVIDFGDADERYVLRQELKGLFSKDAPEYNKQGLLRVVKK